MPRLIWAYFAVFAIVALAIGQQGALAAQIEPSIFASTLGVRHRLQASLSINCDSRSAAECDQIDTDLRLKVLISDHAPDSDFFGPVVATFRGHGSQQGPRTIWKDRKCHLYRGFPKVEVTRIDGSLSRDGRTLKIAATPRQVGKPLPKDEIVVTRLLADHSTGILLANHSTGIMELATKAVTTASNIVFDLRMETHRCKLMASIPVSR